MAEQICGTCMNSGESQLNGMLDCPDCDSAKDRAALNEHLAQFKRDNGAMTEYDLVWYCFQRGRASK